jgi:hypothetical protein
MTHGFCPLRPEVLTSVDQKRRSVSSGVVVPYMQGNFAAKLSWFRLRNQPNTRLFSRAKTLFAADFATLKKLKRFSLGTNVPETSGNMRPIRLALNGRITPQT